MNYKLYIVKENNKYNKYNKYTNNNSSYIAYLYVSNKEEIDERVKKTINDINKNFDKKSPLHSHYISYVFYQQSKNLINKSVFSLRDISKYLDVEENTLINQINKLNGKIDKNKGITFNSIKGCKKFKLYIDNLILLKKMGDII